MFFKARNGKINIDDTEINYITFGEGDKTLVMIPGIGESLTSFLFIAFILSWNAPPCVLFSFYG